MLEYSQLPDRQGRRPQKQQLYTAPAAYGVSRTNIIKNEFDIGTACVISMLMYAEGSIFGTDIVEEFHRKLTRYFNTYPGCTEEIDPNVYHAPDNYALEGKRGIIIVPGHAIGFRYVGNGTITLYDNESRESNQIFNSHQNKVVSAIYAKQL